MRKDLFGGFCVVSISSFLLVLMFSNMFAAETNSEPAQLLATAQKAAKEGDLETSESIYRNIIREFPNTIEAITAYQDSTIHCIQSKRTAEADSLVEALKKSYATFFETADALHSIAQHYQWNGQPEQALNLYRYNSSTYTNTKKGMWSQGAIVHYCIENKDFTNAQKEMQIMLERFKDQPTLPQEIHQFAEKYRTTGELDRALELHKFNTTYSPISSVYTMWSQGAIVHQYIRQKDFIAAKQACDIMVERFSEQPTLPQELHLIAEMYKGADMTDMALELHQYNASHSPMSSMYTMQSMGALIHYYIEQKDFYPAEYEYKEFLKYFKDQPTLPQEIYQFALKYQSVGEIEKALELHRYNATHSPASSLHAMWSQGAVVHYYIEHKDFINAQKEYEMMTDRFKEQPTLPQEIYHFALKYQSVGEIEKALGLHRYNAMNSSVASQYSMWSEGALIHYYIEHKDYDNAQKEYAVILTRFKDQSTLPQEICQIADKYRQLNQYEQALNLSQYGIDTYPDCLWRRDYYKILVSTYLSKGDYEQSMLLSAKWIAECSDRSAYVKTSIDLGSIYFEEKQWKQSLQYYNQALVRAESAEEKLEAYTGVAQVSIWLGEDEHVQEIIDLIVSHFQQEKNYYRSIFVIGEEYYYLAHTNRKTCSQLIENGKTFLQKAISIWQPILDSSCKTDIVAHAWYFSGLAYWKIDEIEHAIDCFMTLTDNWQNYIYNWSALPCIGLGYERLKEQGYFTPDEINPWIEEIYLKTVTEYPNGCMTDYARKGLNKLYQSKNN